MNTLRQIISILTCLMLLAAVAVNRDGRLFGREISLQTSQIEEVAPDNERTLPDGTRVISTRYLAKDVFGYAGNVPLEIYIRDGRIEKVVVLDNSESPDFFEDLYKNKLFDKWNGLTAGEAARQKVDAVTGATMSSEAVINSVMKGVAYASEQPVEVVGTESPGLKFYIVLAVLLFVIIAPLFFKSPRLRMVQLVLNVAVLGFWSGTFISISLLINYVANGVSLRMFIIPAILLFAAFIMPMLGKKNHYCSHVCPMGALQELTGKGCSRKMKISPRMIHLLTIFRDTLWMVILLIMSLGVGFEMVNYEAFPAFLFRQAGYPVIALAVVFIILSLFVQRPYCRFLCPTGSIIRFPQQKK